MRRISSRWTYFNKKLWPVIWFGGLTIFLANLWPQIRTGRASASLVLVPLGMALFGYFLFQKFLGNVVDEVWDAGDWLVVRNGGEEDRIALSGIMNVSYVTLQNPPRVTLALRQPCRFGAEVAFIPLTRFLPFARNAVIDELIQRIDAARRR